MKYLFKQDNQSPWIVDIFNEFLEYKNNGFLVEIGVGHTIKGIDKDLPLNLSDFERCGSNTADLIDLGWSGIYIEPVKEYCDEARIAHINNLNRLTIINMGASNEKNVLKLHMGDSFRENQLNNNGYSWVGRDIEVNETSIILSENRTPKIIDVMSIDVEGFEDKVIMGIDFKKHIPTIIIVEVNHIGIETISRLLPNDYKLINSDNLNAVWVRI